MDIKIGLDTITMCEEIPKSDFILPLVHPNSYYYSQRLTGSIPLALNLGIPLIISKFLANVYNLTGVLTFDHESDSSEFEFESVLTKAQNMTDEEYQILKKEFNECRERIYNNSKLVMDYYVQNAMYPESIIAPGDSLTTFYKTIEPPKDHIPNYIHNYPHNYNQNNINTNKKTTMNTISNKNGPVTKQSHKRNLELNHQPWLKNNSFGNRHSMNNSDNSDNSNRTRIVTNKVSANYKKVTEERRRNTHLQHGHIHLEKTKKFASGFGQRSIEIEPVRKVVKPGNPVTPFAPDDPVILKEIQRVRNLTVRNSPVSKSGKRSSTSNVVKENHQNGIQKQSVKRNNLTHINNGTQKQSVKRNIQPINIKQHKGQKNIIISSTHVGGESNNVTITNPNTKITPSTKQAQQVIELQKKEHDISKHIEELQKKEEYMIKHLEELEKQERIISKHITGPKPGQIPINKPQDISEKRNIRLEEMEQYKNMSELQKSLMLLSEEDLKIITKCRKNINYRVGKLRQKINQIHGWDIESHYNRVQTMKNLYPGKSMVIITCGPSMKTYTPYIEKLIEAGHIITCIKQSYDYVKGLCDFHIVNFCNEKQYDYQADCIKIYCNKHTEEFGKGGMNKYDIYFTHRPENVKINIHTELMKGKDIMSWETRKDDMRVHWGDIMHELGLPLAIQLGIKNIYVIGWDMGNLKNKVYGSDQRERRAIRNVLDPMHIESSKYLAGFLKNHWDINIYNVGKNSALHIPTIDIEKIIPRR